MDGSADDNKSDTKAEKSPVLVELNDSPAGPAGTIKDAASEAEPIS